MKQRTRVKKGKRATKKTRTKGKTIARIRAAAEEGRGRGWMAESELYRPIKRPVTLRLDADVVAWFKADGRGYQTRINQALRKVMLTEKKAAG
jgi:uncharacterized protein (DUF4415 family)